MKRFGFGVRFAALLAAIAAVIVLLVLVVGINALSSFVARKFTKA